MILSKNPIVFSVIDMIITLCFLIYLNAELPFNVDEILLFFNIKRIESIPGLADFFFKSIHNQEASAGFHNRGLTTLFIANNDMLLISALFVECFFIVNVKLITKFRNLCYLKWAVFAFL